MACFVSGAICKCSNFSSSNYSEYPLDIKFNSIVIFTFSLIALNKIFKYAGTGHKFSFKFCDCTKHMKMLPCRFNQFIESSSDTHLLHFLCTYRSLSTSFKLQNIEADRGKYFKSSQPSNAIWNWALLVWTQNCQNKSH